GGGQVAGNAVDPGAIAAVGRDGDVDGDVVDPGIVGIGDADGSIGGQLDDAVMVVGELELGRRAQHAIADRAADIALGDGHVLARDRGGGEGEDRLEPGGRFGRAADHCDHYSRARIDLAYPQLGGIGVLLGRDDVSGDEPLEPGARVDHLLELEADHG